MKVFPNKKLFNTLDIKRTYGFPKKNKNYVTARDSDPDLTSPR